MLYDPDKQKAAPKKMTKEERWKKFKSRISFKKMDKLKLLFSSKLNKANLKTQ